MTKETALEIVASLLAMDCKKFQDVAREFPNLANNARDLFAKNKEVAQALGIDHTFRAKCQVHGVELG